MMDPMANIGPDPSRSGSDDTTGGEGKGIFNLQAQSFNNKKIDEVKTFMGIVNGCFAGICGFQGLQGLLCFLLLDFIVSVAILAKMKFNFKKYSRETFVSFITAHMQKNGLSFALFWTLFYGLVYLF
mmetsp:Transcript_439/g.575  ORF Transcript_439/g.575 Transcript_439/m.575 type:complete len:127 (-) Transcript_439:169-549(-)